MSFSKKPGLWIVMLLAVVLWNLYAIFGPQPETPPQSIVILNWMLVACDVAGWPARPCSWCNIKNRRGA